MAGRLTFAVPKGFDYITRQLSKAFDKSTTALNTIDYAHHEIHEGNHYHLSKVASVSSGGGTWVLRLVTGADNALTHLVFNTVSDQGFTLTFFEGTTFTDNGSAETPQNRRRDSTNNSPLTITSGATINSAGTILLNRRTGAKGVGAMQRGEIEWVLKKSTSYAIRLTNHSAGTAANTTVSLEFYEHLDKNI